ncbi:MAG: hypothetical protein RJA19_1835, partial [Bacteroidota bacterium]
SDNAVVVFPKGSCLPGDYVEVQVHSTTATTLLGEVVAVVAPRYPSQTHP